MIRGLALASEGSSQARMNPGLAGSVAQHITPNLNPLAQQGGPPGPKDVDSLGNPVPTQQPNLASCSGHPARSGQLVLCRGPDALRPHEQAVRRPQPQHPGRVRGIRGTAQQQASKTAALGAGGSVGDLLGSLAGIQKMQDQTVADNEHARFMGSAATFAQTLPSQSLGRPGGRLRKPRPL